MKFSTRMPLQLGQLGIWYFIGYFLIIRLREFTLDGSFYEELAEYKDGHMLALKLSALFAFFSYTLCQYLLLYYGYRRWRWYVLVLVQVGMILSCMFFRAFLEEGIVAAIFGYGNYNPDMPWSTYLWDNVYYAVIFCCLGLVYYFYQLANFNEQRRQESELLQRETELKFLRSQVNPHFLFNTLNNLYALVNANSRHSLTALEKLSALLRYSLYEKAPLVPIEKEID
ncbi:MAG: histidine kinase, partial [Bacteroidota bacterium]